MAAPQNKTMKIHLPDDVAAHRFKELQARLAGNS